MNWENPLFIILLLCGISYISAGFIMGKFPPKKINSLYGYRTKKSMSSIENWRFSQRFSARAMILGGGIMLLFCLAGLFINSNEILSLITALFFLTAITIGIFYKTENALKKRK